MRASSAPCDLPAAATRVRPHMHVSSEGDRLRAKTVRAKFGFDGDALRVIVDRVPAFRACGAWHLREVRGQYFNRVE
eukprot:6177134-Pleurochrysis_carterae.AAC.1